MLADLKFHHYGLALAKEDDALKLLKAMGFSAGDKVFDPLQNVHVRLLTHADKPTVEFVMPGEGGSPIEALIKKHNEMFYHSCYETSDLDKTLADLEDLGLRVLCVAERKPAVLFEGRHVSFYKIFGFGIIEFLEKV